MGYGLLFARDKGVHVVAHPIYRDLYDALDAAGADGGDHPTVEIVIRGASKRTFTIPKENFPEILEILRLTISEDE
jgi:hypothetical protein